MDDDSWFRTPEWQALIAEAEADRLAGRVMRYASDEEFMEALDGEKRDARHQAADVARLMADPEYVAEVHAVRAALDGLGVWSDADSGVA